MKELILAIAIVESSLNPLAIGKDGEVGYLQIQNCVIEDVNYFYGYDYEPEDRQCKQRSIEIFTYYVRHWGAYYERKTGNPLTQRVICDIWNGGATAPLRKETNSKLKKNLDRYWKKVKGNL